MKILDHEDLIMKNVTFESFLELYELYEKEYSIGSRPTLLYDGSTICGDVVVACARYADSEKRNRAVKMASETLKYFS